MGSMGGAGNFACRLRKVRIIDIARLQKILFSYNAKNRLTKRRRCVILVSAGTAADAVLSERTGIPGFITKKTKGETKHEYYF